MVASLWDEDYFSAGVGWQPSGIPVIPTVINILKSHLTDKASMKVAESLTS